MAEWREQEKAMANARHANAGAEEAKLATSSVYIYYSADSCCGMYMKVMARESMALRETFNGPALPGSCPCPGSAPAHKTVRLTPERGKEGL